MSTIWDNLDQPLPTTRKQRKALHKLGYSQWLISHLNRESASQAIRQGVSLVQTFRDPFCVKEAKKSK